MVGGAQHEQGPVPTRRGPEVSRRWFVTTVAAGGILAPEQLAHVVMPGSIAVVAAVTSPASTIWKNVVNAALRLHAPTFRCHSDLQPSHLLTPDGTAEQIEETFLQFVSQRVEKHCSYLKGLQLALAELGGSPEKIGALLKDADELRVLEVTRMKEVAPRALDMIRSAAHHLSSEWSELPVWLQNVSSPLKHCSVEQQQEIALLTEAELVDHISEWDWTIHRRDQRQSVLDSALWEAAHEDTDSVHARAYDAQRDAIKRWHGILTAEIRLVARALRSFPQVFAHSASLVSLPETGRHAAIPHMAHTGFLRVPADALELYRTVAAPDGKWLSPAHQQAFYSLRDSLDALLPEITENALRVHFPEYMNSDSPQKQGIERQISDRAQRAVDRQRAMWPNNLANDYY